MKRTIKGVLASAALLAGVVTGAFAVVAQPASALCASPTERGTWYNQTSSGPAAIDIKMVSCGDQVLNGSQTKTNYEVKVWERQSDGTLYERGTYKAWRQQAEGVTWLVTSVPVGGYVEELWMRAVDKADPAQRLRVWIEYESLDAKPSTTSDSEFLRSAPAPTVRVEKAPPVVEKAPPLRPEKICRTCGAGPVTTGTTTGPVGTTIP